MPEQPTQQQIETYKERVRKDPVWFVENTLRNPIWQIQKDILEAIRDYKEVSVKSCHASGKSYILARAVHWYLSAYPREAIVITTAPTFRQVKEVLWREIKGSVEGKKIYPDKAMLDVKIDISPQWFALGLSTNKPDAFQGFHSPHLMVLVDEASGIEQDIEEAIDGLTPEKVVRIGQPLKATGRFADSFKLPNVKKMTISAFDTPNVISGTNTIPGLITKDDVEKFRLNYGEDSDVYRIRVLGELPSQDSNSLIAVDAVAKAIEREVFVPKHFEKKMGVDVARFGDDRTCIVIRHMEKVIRKEVYYGLDTMQITGHVLRVMKDEMVLSENINIDVIGIGAGVVDRMKEQGFDVNEVNVATRATDHENYINLRAELYADKVRSWIKKADLPNDDDFYELANIRYEFTSTGKFQIESKEQMKKRDLDSPDVADALMLTFAERGHFETPVQSQPLEGVYPDLGL